MGLKLVRKEKHVAEYRSYVSVGPYTGAISVFGIFIA
jgi:hypothetical protein